MKIEKLNKNTLEVLLTIEELSLKNITLEDIEKGRKKAQNFFFDIIENSDYANEFLHDDLKLLVEASVTSDNNLIVRITKMACQKNFKNISTIQKHPKHLSNFFIFNSAENLYLFSKQVLLKDLFCGTNSLYVYDGTYIVEFSKSTVKNDKFKATSCIISEFCADQYSNATFECYVHEYATPLICHNALKTLVSYILA